MKGRQAARAARRPRPGPKLASRTYVRRGCGALMRRYRGDPPPLCGFMYPDTRARSGKHLPRLAGHRVSTRLGGDVLPRAPFAPRPLDRWRRRQRRRAARASSDASAAAGRGVWRSGASRLFPPASIASACSGRRAGMFLRRFHVRADAGVPRGRDGAPARRRRADDAEREGARAGARPAPSFVSLSFAPRARGGLPQLARPRSGESVLGQGRRLP